MGETLLTIFILVSCVWVVARLADYAERARMKELRSEALLEITRKTLQKKRLDELYGRDREQ